MRPFEASDRRRARIANRRSENVGGTSRKVSIDGPWMVEPEVADLLGRALLFAAGVPLGGVSLESFTDVEWERMVAAGLELRGLAREAMDAE